MTKIFKKLGLSVMLLAGLLTFAAPRQANAAVRFGVQVGPPAYAYPAYPYYPYGYPYYYGYPGAVYGPSVGFGLGFGHGFGGHGFHGGSFGGHFGRR